MKPLSSTYHFIIILLFAIFLMMPAFYCGATGIDIFTVARWAQYFSEELRSGILYPRWLPQLFAGHGSPVFFFYPPLPFYVIALFYPLTHLDALGFYPIACAGLLGLMIGGVCCYQWLLRETTSSCALLGALLYMVLPPYVANSFYYYILIGQFWAFSWFPLLLWMAHRVARGEKYASLGFSLALFLLLLTNMPNFIFFAPIAVLYCFILSARCDYKRTFFYVSVASITALGLASFYLFPAVAYQKYTLIDIQWHNPEQSYAMRLFGLSEQPYQTMRVMIISLAMVVFAAGMLLIMSRYALRVIPERSIRYRIVFWCAVSLIALFLNTWLSVPLWEHVPFLKIVQIPSRLLAISAIGCVCIMAHLLRGNHKVGGEFFVFIAALSVGAWVWNSLCRELPYTQFLKNPESAAAQEYLEKDSIPFMLSIDQRANYLTSTQLISRFFEPQNLKLFLHDNPRIERISGDAEVTIEAWRNRHIELSVAASRDSIIAVRQFYFPGWVAHSEEDSIPITRDEKSGKILLYVPARDHKQTISLTLTQLAPERIGYGISFLMLMVVGVMGRKKM